MLLSIVDGRQVSEPAAHARLVHLFTSLSKTITQHHVLGEHSVQNPWNNGDAVLHMPLPGEHSKGLMSVECRPSGSCTLLDWDYSPYRSPAKGQTPIRRAASNYQLRLYSKGPQRLLSHSSMTTMYVHTHGFVFLRRSCCTLAARSFTAWNMPSACNHGQDLGRGTARRSW
jgi:hypothetical protein